MKVWSGTETTVPKKQEKRGKVLFRPLSKNSVNMVVFLGGIGVLVKVPHVDREFSFGNRHSKTSTPKYFFDFFWKSSRPTPDYTTTPEVSYSQPEKDEYGSPSAPAIVELIKSEKLEEHPEVENEHLHKNTVAEDEVSKITMSSEH